MGSEWVTDALLEGSVTGSRGGWPTRLGLPILPGGKIREIQYRTSRGDDDMDMTLAIALILGAFVLGFALGKKGPGSEALPTVAPDPTALAAVESILASEGKIAAIKAYREKTGTGLRDAKLAVDSLG
jgi:hypothetical protein